VTRRLLRPRSVPGPRSPSWLALLAPFGFESGQASRHRRRCLADMERMISDLGVGRRLRMAFRAARISVW
jgi:hypothetical protein